MRVDDHPDPVPELTSLEAANLVVWLQAALTRQMAALLPESEETSQAIRRSLTELEVEAPTRWELTLDVTNTPAWREIVAQMRERSRLMRRERILIFTPEGATALPADRAVNWAGNEVSTQKHVLIACRWPKPEDTVHVKARHLFAQQSCSKLEQAFWELAPTVN